MAHLGGDLTSPYAMPSPGELGGWGMPPGVGMMPPGANMWWDAYANPAMQQSPFLDPAAYGGQPGWPPGAYPGQQWPNPYMQQGLPADMGAQGGKGGRRDRGQQQQQKSHLQLSDHLGEHGQGGGKGKSKGKGGAPQQQQQQQQQAAAPREQIQSTVKPGEETTVMLRNVPNGYTRGMLVELLNSQGFQSKYDFVYLPMDFRNGVNLGYAFVNLVDHQAAGQFTETLQGFSAWVSDSTKVCEITWAHPHQGLAEHVERYRNSPVMHPSMDQEYKPMVFKNGVQQVFPPPTKAIKAPKLRLTARDAKAEG